MATTTFAGKAVRVAGMQVPEAPARVEVARESRGLGSAGRKAAIIGIAFEVLFLGSILVYLMSTFSLYQNCL